MGHNIESYFLAHVQNVAV